MSAPETFASLLLAGFAALTLAALVGLVVVVRGAFVPGLRDSEL